MGRRRPGPRAARCPLTNQQFSTSFGGPVLRDKLHFFVNYEYDRLPQTTIANTAWPTFNVELTGKTVTNLSAARLDYQLSPANRLMVKGSLTTFEAPFMQLGSDHPAGSGATTNDTTNLQTVFTSVLSNRAVNEIKVGYAGYGFEERNLTTWSNHPLRERGITNGHPRIQFTGFNITGNNNWPRYWFQDAYNLRDDFTTSYDLKGRHDVKAGFEFIWDKKISANCTSCMGRIDARGGPSRPTSRRCSPIRSTWTRGTSTRFRRSSSAIPSASRTRSPSPSTSRSTPGGCRTTGR